MLDVRLITVIPATPAIAQPGAAGTITTQTGAPALPQLPNGTMLSGFIINRDTSGNPILRTETGDVIFASNLFLKIGSEVVLRLQNTVGKQEAHLISVNGQSPEVGVGQSAFSDEPDVIIGQKQPLTREQTAAAPQTASAQSTASALPKIGQTISAIVVTPSFTPGQPASVKPGTSLLLNVLGFSMLTTQTTQNPALSQLTSSTTPQTAPATPANPALSSLLPDAVDTVPSLIIQPITTPKTVTPATQITTTTTPENISTPQTVTTPAAPPITAAAPLATSNQQAAQSNFGAPLGQAILTVVAAQHEDGSLILQSPVGSLRVANMPNLPIGQPLALRVSSIAQPNPYTLSVASNTEPLPPAPLTELARNWSSLGQLVQLLGGGGEDSPLAIPTIPMGLANTPNLPAQITQNASQILFFISALKGGSFRDWLGSSQLKSLEEKGYSSLIKKAEGEFMQIARAFVDPQPGNWQMAFIPILAGQELQQLRAFIKREKKKDENGKPTGEEDTRFVLEMDLTQLGEMQMDGLVKRRDEKLQFDLVIRSHQPLPNDLQRDIQTIYTSTAELTGYRGSIMFQHVSDFPVHPAEDTLPHADDVIA